MTGEDSKEFDVIIFGATGYTGRYAIEELVHATKPGEIKWAVAGRNVEKLKETLQTAQSYLGGIDIQGTTIIKADVEDESSIFDMCKRAKVILNSVGPYWLYGTVVIKACIENGTHYVDISVEKNFLESTQANYFEAARAKGIYIVHPCGYDSVATDLGISIMRKRFPGDLNSVETYAEPIRTPENGSSYFNILIAVALNVKDDLHTKCDLLKEKVFKMEMPEKYHPLTRRFPLFYSDIVKSWCVWFVGPDDGVIERSQMFRYEYLNERPVQVHNYLRIRSLLIAIFYLFFAGLYGFLSKFSCGRYLLDRFPTFFTAGTILQVHLPRTEVEKWSFKLTLCGNGWTEKLSDPSDQHTNKPNKKMKLIICGPEPSYPFTSMCMVNAGLVILQDKEKLPLEGGVLTPGVAFENTTLCDRLQRRGVSFKFED